MFSLCNLSYWKKLVVTQRIIPQAGEIHVLFWRSVFVLLSLICWPLYCLSFFDLQPPITIGIFQTTNAMLTSNFNISFPIYLYVVFFLFFILFLINVYMYYVYMQKLLIILLQWVIHVKHTTWVASTAVLHTSKSVWLNIVSLVHSFCKTLVMSTITMYPLK
jgi:hypothetical protein